MNLSRAVELIDKGENLDAAKRTVKSNLNFCKKLLEDIERQQREMRQEEAELRSKVFKDDPNKVWFRSKVKDCFLSAFNDLDDHYTAFKTRLDYEDLTTTLTLEQYNKIMSMPMLVDRLDEVIKYVNK